MRGVRQDDVQQSSWRLLRVWPAGLRLYAEDILERMDVQHLLFIMSAILLVSRRYDWEGQVIQRSKPDRGVVTARQEVINEHGQSVMSLDGKSMLRVRP